MNNSHHVVRRPYQRAALREFVHSASRFWALLWERQAGKSTPLADFALYEMLKHPNRTVIYGSASLLLAQEITLKTAIRANQTVSQLVERDAAALKQFADTAQSTIDAQTEKPAPSNSHRALLRQFYARDQLKGPCPRTIEYHRSTLWPPGSHLAQQFPLPLPKAPAQSRLKFKVFDAQTEKEVPSIPLREADFAELFRQQRLEFRVYYEPNSYSRMKVIAPNIATARSWSGTVLLDEVAFIRNLRELITALLPVISTDKQFKLILSTTPPEFDDTHYSFELLAPPAGVEFKPCAEGNWYTSESGVRVHRADAYDTALAGKKIFDLKTGEEISPEEAFTRAPNKNGHRIAHWLTWMVGGLAACDLLRLRTAQERGRGQCENFQINSDADMVTGLNWLSENAGGKSSFTSAPSGSSLITAHRAWL